MPSPSKLTENQWRRLHERLLAGESARALAREAGITEAAVRKRFGAMGTLVAQSTKVRAAAKALADGQQALAAGERAIAALPLAHRSVAISLAERLANVSTNLAAAAELGSATAHRLHALANAEAQRIDDADPTANPDALRAVAALTTTANAAASIPLSLIAANRAASLPGAEARPASRGWSAEHVERIKREFLGLSADDAPPRAAEADSA